MKQKIALMILPVLLLMIGLQVKIYSVNASTSSIDGTCTCSRTYLTGNITCTGCSKDDIEKKCKGDVSNIKYHCTKNIISPPKAGEALSPESACKLAGGDLVFKSGSYNVKYNATCTPTTNFVISLNREGGNLSGGDFKYAHDGGIGSYTYSTKTTANSITIKLPTSGTKTGYSFDGISSQKSCAAGTKLGSTVTIPKSSNYKTYYACWKKLPSSNNNNNNNNNNNSNSSNNNNNSINKPKPPTIVEVPVVEPIKTEINDFRYVGNATKINFAGGSASCGDKVFITTCDESRNDDATCNVTFINGAKVTNNKIYRQSLKEAKPSCPEIKRYSLSGATYYTDLDNIGKSSRKVNLACGEELIFKDLPSETCIYGDSFSNSTDNAKSFCEVTYKDKTVYVDRTRLVTKEPVCFSEELEEEKKPNKKEDNFVSDYCESSSPRKNQKSHNERRMTICYTYQNKKLLPDNYDEKNIFTCDKDYRRIQKIDRVNSNCDELTDSNRKQECHKSFYYSCASIDKPKVSGKSSVATPEGVGTLSIKGIDSNTESGLKGYIVNEGGMPTLKSEWTPFPNSELTDVVTVGVGTHFVWTITNDTSISYPIMLRVHSDDVTTTAENIEIRDPETEENHSFNALKSNDEPLAYNNEIMGSNYVRLSNELNNKSLIAEGFNLFNTAYELTVNSNKIAIHATLTSNDAKYAEGYEPRTVNLDYGRNIVLIKVINNQGKERTYTFIITRNDNRESINILSSLTTSLGNINFDPYVSDYTVSIPKNSKSVNINGTLDSHKSAFVKGYEPRNIELKDNITSALLKTISEAGIIRSYVVTFIKTGAKIEDNIEKSPYLSSLTMPGAELNFERDIVNYTASVPYHIEDLPIYALPESKNSTIEINGNQNLAVGTNKIEVIVTNNSIVKIYNIFINRKEAGLEVENNTKLESLTVKGYNLDFREDIYDYELKIKREKNLLFTATPQSHRSEVYMYGNNDLTAFSTVRIKVIAENGNEDLYSVDIIKDTFNKKLNTTLIIVGSMILLGGTIITIVLKKRKALKEYREN